MKYTMLYSKWLTINSFDWEGRKVLAEETTDRGYNSPEFEGDELLKGTVYTRMKKGIPTNWITIPSFIWNYLIVIDYL